MRGHGPIKRPAAALRLQSLDWGLGIFGGGTGERERRKRNGRRAALRDQHQRAPSAVPSQERKMRRRAGQARPSRASTGQREWALRCGQAWKGPGCSTCRQAAGLVQRGAARCSAASGSSDGAGMGRKGGGSKWFRGPVGIGRRGEMVEYGDPLARIAQDTLGFRA